MKIIIHSLVALALLGNVAILGLIQTSTGQAASASFDNLEVTLLTTPDCEECFDLAPFQDYLVQNGISEDNIKELAYDSFRGKRLVKKYEVTAVPTVVVAGDVNNYDFMIGLIETIAEVRNGAAVITTLQPPYLDLETDQLRGVFEAIYLDDEICEECYDLALHEEIFDRLAMIPSQKRTVDVASEEGRALVDTYFVTAVPTIILQGDLEAYNQFGDIWTQVGTIEEDGTYILRQGVESMGTYKRLTDGEVVVPELEPEEEN